MGFVLALLEIALRTIPALQELDSPRPVYIPQRLVEADRELSRAQRETARRHRFGFNDVDRDPHKDPGTFRLVVLGDSFVFGDGVSDEVRWGRKLTRRLEDRYDNVEVLLWGRNGWSTLEQHEFLEENLGDWQVDAMLVGWVTNDADMGETARSNLGIRKTLKRLGYGLLLPEASKWLEDYLSAALNPVFGTGYLAWRRRLYEPENLDRWGDLLKRLDALLVAEGVPYIFVMTPNHGGEHFDFYYEHGMSRFRSAGAPYLNLLPAVRRELGREPSRAYWANPADGHPGHPVTTVYADEVARLIEEACAHEGRRLLRCRF